MLVLKTAYFDTGEDGYTFQYQHIVDIARTCFSQPFIVYPGKYGRHVRYYMPVRWNDDLGAADYLCNIDDYSSVDIRHGKVDLCSSKNIGYITSPKIFFEVCFLRSA